jgi:hypothetical protein
MPASRKSRSVTGAEPQPFRAGCGRWHLLRSCAGTGASAATARRTSEYWRPAGQCRECVKVQAAVIESRNIKFDGVSPCWRRNWARITPFFNYPVDIRKAIYTTNSVESLNRSLRNGVSCVGGCRFLCACKHESDAQVVPQKLPAWKQ